MRQCKNGTNYFQFYDTIFSGGDSETYTKAVSLNRFSAILIKGDFAERQVKI